MPAGKLVGGPRIWSIRLSLLLGWKQAFSADPHFAEGLNVHLGQVHHPKVAKALGVPVVGLRRAA